jgi:hypothetical protein
MLCKGFHSHPSAPVPSFPHLTVRKNIAFGLQMRRVPRAGIRRRVDEALRLVHLEEHAGKLPGQLSGGQQQRVAIARAVVLEPALVLMDEPLSNLDAKLRLEMRTEIRRLHQSLGLTTVDLRHPAGHRALQVRLRGHLSGVVLANLVPSVPFVILTMTPFIEQIDPAIERAARMCGAGTRQVFVRILAPLLVPGILAASILVLVRTVGMFELTFLTAGPDSQTLVVRCTTRCPRPASGPSSRSTRWR